MKKIAKTRAEARFKRRSDLAESEARYSALLVRLNSLPLSQVRSAFAKDRIPRFIYKYRSIPAETDATATDRLRDILVRNRLWMANIHSLNDPFDSYIQYRVTLSGAELRCALQKFFRRTTDAVSFKADMLVDSDVVANPRRVEEMLKAAHDQFVDQFGVCSFSAEARNKLLWAHYANQHHGLAIQFEPARDPRNLLTLPMQYEAAHRVVVDEFGGGDRESTRNELLIKDVEWAYEKEWRLIERGRSNVIREFRPTSLTGIILGLRTTEDEVAAVHALLRERSDAGLPKPRLYRMVNLGARLRVAGVM